MKVIIALGNPGTNYIRTRHNTGFLYADFLISEFGNSNWKHESKLRADIYDLFIENQKILVVKPTTFMNDSGTAVYKCLQFYKTLVSDIIVVHDDLDIFLGKYKLVKQKGPKGHNGLLSIEKHIHTDEFIRLRIGVNNRLEDMNRYQSGEEYLLSVFTQEEFLLLSETFTKTLKELIFRLIH